MTESEHDLAEGMEFFTDAGRLLSETWGVGVRVCRPALVARRGRAETWRAEVETSGSASAPGSVIVKRAIAESDCFFDECAGLQFIKGLRAIQPVAPEILACDLSSRLLVMEDLGDGQSLEDITRFSDTEERALVDLAVVTGRLHAAAVGREAEYERVRETMGVPAQAAVRATQSALLSRRHGSTACLMLRMSSQSWGLRFRLSMNGNPLRELSLTPGRF